jgi:hypothetical protein
LIFCCKEDAMVDEDRRLAPNTPSSHRAQRQGPRAATPPRPGGDPEADWGEEADEGALLSSNHSRRPIRTEAERSQGRKTRQLNKDIVSRRT